MTIFALIEKGIAVASMAITAGKNAGPALQAVKELVTGAQQGTVTDEQLAATESILDGQIEEFNKPLE